MTSEIEREKFDEEAAIDWAMQTYESHEEQWAFMDGVKWQARTAQQADAWQSIESAKEGDFGWFNLVNADDLEKHHVELVIYKRWASIYNATHWIPVTIPTPPQAARG